MKDATDRGLSTYGIILDANAARVRVQTSSAAAAPHLWVFIEGGCAGPNKGAAHLTIPQAIALRDALSDGIAAALQSEGP